MKRSILIAITNVLNVLFMFCLIVDGFICFFGGKELVEQILPSTVGLLCFLGADYALLEISSLTDDEDDDEDDDFNVLDADEKPNDVDKLSNFYDDED